MRAFLLDRVSFRDVRLIAGNVRERKQTAVTNIFILYLTFRMLQHTSSEVTVKTVTLNFKKLERGPGD